MRKMRWICVVMMTVCVSAVRATAAPPAVARAASGVLDAEGECGYLKRAVCAAEAAHSGARGYAIPCVKYAADYAYVSDFIEIDPGLRYELSGWLRNGGAEPVTAHFGIESYDANKQRIELVEVRYHESTFSRLAADAKAGDDSILIEGSLKAYIGHPWMPVAFHADATFADLPNRDLSPPPAAVWSEEAGIRVKFASPLTNHYPKGTAVRQHNRFGAVEQPWACFFGTELTREWKEYRNVIEGGSAYQTRVDRFRPGTRYVRLIMWARANGGKEGVVYADELALRAVGKAVAEPAYIHVPFCLVKLDRFDALYRCGEKAEFRIVKKVRGLDEITNGTLTAVFTLDGGRVIATRTADVAGPPDALVFRETLNEPGFLRCNVTYADGAKVYSSRVVAAGFDVERIRPGDQAPADLASYWHGELARLEKEVPFDLRIAVEKEDGEFTYYRLSGANFDGTRITAGLTVPKAKGPFPIRVFVPGAGPDSTPMVTVPGCVGLSISVFDRIFGPGEYEAFNKTQWYFYKGAESRETYYYYKSILGAMRMVTYAMTRPEWDRKNLFVTGGSQGGGFSLIIAGLFSDSVTGVAAAVPALCDHNGKANGRTAGWPQLMTAHSNVANYAKYYDAALFATRIKCPVIVSVGFIDTMCVPSSVYAAYNGVSSEKRIFNAPLGGHGDGVASQDNFSEDRKVFFEKCKK